MRLIDADYVLSKIGEYADHPNEELVNNLAIAFDIVCEAPTVSLPSIDICFCKECKYNSICNRGVQHTTRDMSSITIGYKSVDFCSYGERRES